MKFFFSRTLLTVITLAVLQSCSKENPTGSNFSFDLVDGGTNYHVISTAYDSHDGYASVNGGITTIYYGASNQNNAKSFGFQCMVQAATAGTYTMSLSGGTASIVFNFSEIATSNAFISINGSVIIEEFGLAGGFVKGSFNGTLQADMPDQSVKNVQISGQYNLRRVL